MMRRQLFRRCVNWAREWKSGGIYKRTPKRIVRTVIYFLNIFDAVSLFYLYYELRSYDSELSLNSDRAA